MTTRDRAPLGAPCWVDLWTSDVPGSVKFYSALFGWAAQDPDPEHGGYFMFTRNGVPIAGAMGEMGDEKPSNTWKVYLASADAEKTVAAAEAGGATISLPAMTVGDAGTQAVLDDPTGATIGSWQPEEFAGFTVLEEHGAPSWFELLTRDYAKAVEFYRSVFGWDTEVVSDTDEFRYSVMLDPSGGGMLAGIMDASSFLPKGEPASWSVYWDVNDVDESVAQVKSLGGGVITVARDTPYGRLASLTDPSGAPFNLRAVIGDGV
ncbi:MAG: VOC family protein [Acidimicrobiales bacterium]